MRSCHLIVYNSILKFGHFLREILRCLVCRCYNNKVSAEQQTRQIEVGAVGTSSKKHNKIKTSKYTLLMFLPKNLTEQFRRVVNFYFLLVTIVSFFIDSPVSPMTSVIPLSFMVMVTAVKQGYEDWLRHKADNKVNNQIVEIIQKGVVKEVRNAGIAPGTLVRVRSGREVPADLVLLCVAGDMGKCFVTTANLDGETNLKTLRVPPPLVGYSPDILPQGMRIEVPQPVADLYTFYGRLEIPSMDSLVLSPDNLMLRGSRVRNIEWAIGCAVYTGEETKLALNSKYTGNKFSSCELAVNGFLLFFILLLIFEMILSYTAKLLLERNNPGHDTYLGPGTPYPAPLNTVFQDVFSFLLLYYYIIPMSLYVTIELYKFIGALFIGWDEELRCDETGQPAVANTSDLNEELGQVEVLFSDKTGTLTKNLMVFKACSILGRVYEERDSKLYDVEDYDEPVDILQPDIKFFFTILALCHSVQISREDMKKLSVRLSAVGNKRFLQMFKKKKISKENGLNNSIVNDMAWDGLIKEEIDSKIEYQGSSPDEKALVEAADTVGVTFLGEEGNNLILRVGSDTEMYERLQTIEFTSERKRMSVILRDRNGKIWLFCKGAESSVFPICNDSPIISETDRDINAFANKGLRTLAVAFREIPDEEYESVLAAINNVDGESATELAQLTQAYLSLEQRLTLVGATGVEDCLQDHVADTLAALRRAGLRLWVLTGDKVETAINVAQSCSHISENDRRMFLLGIDSDTSLQSQLQECHRISNEPSFKELTLIVDGGSMSMILDSPFAKDFVEISMKCSAVLCCRLSPIQKAKIVKLIKNSPTKPITAAIGDGANDISMIQEAHVGFGIFGREGHQAARCADYAFTKFSMIKKVLLVMGHWYYQRLATLIHYFFYKNLVLGNIMIFFQIHNMFSTQSIYDSMYLTFYNLFFTSVPCLVLSVTEQRWSSNVLMSNPALYREISRNKLMTWPQFIVWLIAGTYHSLVIYLFVLLLFHKPVLSKDMKTVDLWCLGATLFHLSILIVNLKLWLQARYHTLVFVGSVTISVLIYVLFNTGYSAIYVQIDGDVLGTYQRLLASVPFYLLNILVVVTCLAPDFGTRLFSDNLGRKILASFSLKKPSVFSTRL